MGRLRCALALARFTGHRESAILRLWVSDLLLTPERIARALVDVGRDEADVAHTPNGAIRWRAANDKQGVTHVTPLSRAAREELDCYLVKVARVGDTPRRIWAVNLGGNVAARGQQVRRHSWTPVRRDGWSAPTRPSSQTWIRRAQLWTEMLGQCGYDSDAK